MFAKLSKGLDIAIQQTVGKARDNIFFEAGKITIETAMANFDKAYRDDHEGFIPGDFVRLTVSDDGCGMGKKDSKKCL
jgi:hypothetical protein